MGNIPISAEMTEFEKDAAINSNFNGAMKTTDYVTGSGSNSNKVDHAILADTASAAAGGSALAIKLLPTGMLYPYAGTGAPLGSLLCDGSAVSRTTYANLFSAIGTTWGAGNGSTTFNLPNLKGRTLIGAGLASSGTNYNIGSVGGAETQSYGLGSGYAKITVDGSGVGNYRVTEPNWTSNLLATASDSLNSTSYSSATALGGSTDSGNNMQPYAVVNYLIVY